MRSSTFYKIILLILILLPVVFFIFLVCQNFVIHGFLEASYNFKKPSPFILPLAPKDRISEIESEGRDYYQSLFDSPVYFDVRLPRQFARINFWVECRAAAEETIQLAAFYNKDDWHYQVKDFNQVENLGDGWQRGEVEFDLTDKKFAWQKYQFMISLPQIRDSGRRVDIREIRVLALREPLTPENFWLKLGRWWRRIFNKL